MKATTKIGLITTLGFIMSSGAQAEDAQSISPLYIENAIIILNLTNKGGEAPTGFLLATPCTGCAPQRLEVSPQTQLYLQGRPTQFTDLGLKIDWQGSVFYLPAAQPVVTELFLN